MTSRYGRNQRRAARQRIAALEAENRDVLRRANFNEGTIRRLQEQLRTVREDTVTAWLKHAGHVDLFRERLARGLIEAMEPELRAAARQILDSVASYERGRRPLFDLRAIPPSYSATEMSQEVHEIQGDIIDMHYRVAVWP